MQISDQQRFPPITATLKDNSSVDIRFLAVEDVQAYGDFYLSIKRAAYRFYCPHPLTLMKMRKKGPQQLYRHLLWG